MPVSLFRLSRIYRWTLSTLVREPPSDLWNTGKVNNGIRGKDTYSVGEDRVFKVDAHPHCMDEQVFPFYVNSFTKFGIIVQ